MILVHFLLPSSPKTVLFMPLNCRNWHPVSPPVTVAHACTSCSSGSAWGPGDPAQPAAAPPGRREAGGSSWECSPAGTSAAGRAGCGSWPARAGWLVARDAARAEALPAQGFFSGPFRFRWVGWGAGAGRRYLPSLDVNTGSPSGSQTREIKGEWECVKG